jgi:hypothetical protein
MAIAEILSEKAILYSKSYCLENASKYPSASFAEYLG